MTQTDGAVKIVASCLEDPPRTDFLIVAVTCSEDPEEHAFGLASNLWWHDQAENGKLKPPNVGMHVDRGPADYPKVSH